MCGVWGGGETGGANGVQGQVWALSISAVLQPPWRHWRGGDCSVANRHSPSLHLSAVLKDWVKICQQLNIVNGQGRVAFN